MMTTWYLRYDACHSVVLTQHSALSALSAFKMKPFVPLLASFRTSANHSSQPRYRLNTIIRDFSLGISHPITLQNPFSSDVKSHELGASVFRPPITSIQKGAVLIQLSHQVLRTKSLPDLCGYCWKIAPVFTIYLRFRSQPLVSSRASSPMVTPHGLEF